MDETAAPRRRFKKNSPFLKEEATFIIMKFAEAKSMKKIQWLFRSKFFPKNPRKVPDIWTFYRVIERFKEEGTSHPLISAGISPEGDALKMDKVERCICCNTNRCSTVEKIFVIEVFHTLSNKCFKYSSVSMKLSLDYTVINKKEEQNNF